MAVTTYVVVEYSTSTVVVRSDVDMLGYHVSIHRLSDAYDSFTFLALSVGVRIGKLATLRHVRYPIPSQCRPTSCYVLSLAS